MSKLTYIIDSHDRLDEKSSHSDFTFALNLPPLGNTQGSGLMVAVLRACIPRSYYLINSTTGNTFTLTENDFFSVPITIPYGSPNVQSFSTALTNLLNTNSPTGLTYTIAYDSWSAKFTFTCTGTASFTFTPRKGSGLHEQFGVSASQTNSSTYTLPFTSPNVVNFRIKDTIQIHSDICSAGKNDTMQDIVFGSLPNFSSATYNSTEAFMNAKILNTSSSNTYYMRITDEDNNIIDTNGVNITVTICIFQPIEFLTRKFYYENLKDKDL